MHVQRMLEMDKRLDTGVNFKQINAFNSTENGWRHLKENDRKQFNRNQNEVFLKPNCLAQISCKSVYKQGSY